MKRPINGMKLMSTSLHFDVTLKTHAEMTLLAKIFRPMSVTKMFSQTIWEHFIVKLFNLKIWEPFIVNQFKQMFKLKKMSLLMCTIPLLHLVQLLLTQPDKMQQLRNRLSKTRFKLFTSQMTSPVVQVKPHLRPKTRKENCEEDLRRTEKLSHQND